MLISDLFEVNMSPGVLRGYLSTEFAQSCIVGFEFELVVPGLEDIAGHNSGNDLSKNQAFPTGEDWKAQAFAWLVGGSKPSALKWINTQLNKFEKEFHEWQFVEFKDYLQRLPGKKAIKAIVTKLRAASGGDTPELITSSIQAGDNYYTAAVTEVKAKYFAKNANMAKFIQILPIATMQDFCDEMALLYPYKHQYKAKTTIKKVADNFAQVTKLKVASSKTYHNLDREPGLWIFEPDTSIKDPSIQGAGVELVSPPMPLAQGLTALDTVWSWCQSKLVTTNESTGMHINVSIPNHATANIDYIKLILFLGDEYVLKTFGREANEYTQALVKVMKKNLNGRIDIDSFMETIKRGINKIAQSVFRKNLVYTSDRYVTVNIKENYIEFRSAGGNYLTKKDLIVNTLARYIRALSLAVDPNAETEEYGKKLYKLTRSVIIDDPNSINDIFVKFAAGQISQQRMKLALTNRWL